MVPPELVLDPVRHKPVTALELALNVSSIELAVINFSGIRDTIELNAPPWVINIEPRQDLIGALRLLYVEGGFRQTHHASIRRFDGDVFPIADVGDLLDALAVFLSFVRGAWCGLTMIRGNDTAGLRVWEQLSVSNVDRWGGNAKCIDNRDKQAMSSLFSGFWAAYLGSATADRSLVALDFYLSSNVQPATYSSIVLTQVALERLAYVQVYGKQRREKEGEWIARALTKAQVDTQIPSQYVQLEQFRRVHNFDHGPHTLVEIRDDLIHQDMDYGVLQADIYLQAKALGLWYVELMLLKQFGYQGTYQNRIKQQVEPVPWSSTTDTP